MGFNNDEPKGRNRPASDRAPMCPICQKKHFGAEHVWDTKKTAPAKAKAKGKKR